MIFSKKMVLSNRIALGYDLSCTICKGGSFFPENTIFFPWTENEKGMIFLRKYTEAWYFLCKRTGATNVTPRSSPAKKNQRWSYPTKIHIKVIDVLDWHSRKSPNNSLYFHGGLCKRFHILISSEKKQETEYIGLNLDLFLNLFGWRYSIMNNLQYFEPLSPQELYLEVCLSTNQGNYLSIKRWVIIPKIEELW